MIPTGIVADRAAGILTVDWEDGHHSVYDLPTLRWACPCASCAGEWGRPGRLATLTSLPPEEVRLTDLSLTGGYGITPTWASGHHHGIYSFEYLRTLCPCANCVAARSESS